MQIVGKMHLLPKFSLLIVLVAVVHSDLTLAKKSYRGHKVYSVTPTSDQDCYFLLTLQKLGVSKRLNSLSWGNKFLRAVRNDFIDWNIVIGQNNAHV